MTRNEIIEEIKAYIDAHGANKATLYSKEGVEILKYFEEKINSIEENKTSLLITLNKNEK